eukprot:scaffold133273_cov71-Phaeocystis_antarctica.AAC.8
MRAQQHAGVVHEPRRVVGVDTSLVAALALAAAATATTAHTGRMFEPERGKLQRDGAVAAEELGEPLLQPVLLELRRGRDAQRWHALGVEETIHQLQEIDRVRLGQHTQRVLDQLILQPGGKQRALEDSTRARPLGGRCVEHLSDKLRLRRLAACELSGDAPPVAHAVQRLGTLHACGKELAQLEQYNAQ